MIATIIIIIIVMVIIIIIIIIISAFETFAYDIQLKLYEEAHPKFEMVIIKSSTFS